MSLYRASPADGIAWVTGASTGIGRLVALDLAKEGYTVAASARSKDKLASLAEETTGFSGRIVPFPVDVTDRERMARCVAEIETELGPVVLAIFNAGDYFPVYGESLNIDNMLKTYDINVFGVIYGLVPLIERMREARRGHVAFVGSVSAYGGLPLASAYGASKAAVNNMAEALKFDFDKMNIRIQMVNPGFIDTPLTAQNNFAMPALMPADKAASRLVEGLKTGGFEITFPRRFTWMLKIINLLPHALYFPVMKRAMGWDKRPLKSLRRSLNRKARAARSGALTLPAHPSSTENST